MEDKVFCSDILDALTQDFFARKGNPIEEPAHVEEIKVNHPDPPDLDGLWWFLKGVDFTDLDELLFSWPPGDNVCGSAWIRANLVVVVETAGRILCIAHTEGLEGTQPNYSHNWDGVILRWFNVATTTAVTYLPWILFSQVHKNRATGATVSKVIIFSGFWKLWLNWCFAGGGAGDFRRWVSTCGASQELVSASVS